MLAVTPRLALGQGSRPPFILVHGAANSAAVWTFWQQELVSRGFASYAVDLRGHGESAPFDLSKTTMADYAADVLALARQLARPPILVGWSMGGLVAMLAAERACALGCVGLAPSAPARRRDHAAPLRAGTFGPEAYGITSRDPDDRLAMPDLDREERTIALASLGLESQLAKDERAAGVVLDSLPCPLLVVTGTADSQWPRSRYADLPVTADHLEVEGTSHWGLVLSRKALGTLVPRVLGWLAGRVAGRPPD